MQSVSKRRHFLFQEGKIVYKKDEPVPGPVTEIEFLHFFSDAAEMITPLTAQDDGDVAVSLRGDFAVPAEFQTIGLRRLVGRIDDSAFSLWGRASHILQWAERHRFCGSCGQKTEPHTEELAIFCRQCDRYYYPATAPCVIVLVHRGPEVLLGRSPRFPKKIFSTLAGFIEPCESAEEAVHREIREEVGVEIKTPQYFSSQPWPFPGQLMLGFYAEYLSGEIKIDGNEIAEAGWFSAGDLPDIPIAATIAGTLIRNYFNGRWQAK